MSGPGWTLEDNEDHLVLRVHRQLSLEETMDAVAKTLQCKTADRRLWVTTKCMGYSTPELRAIARNAKTMNWPAGSRTALVAADDFSFGLCRMYEVFRDEEENRHGAFRTEEEALAWLRASSPDR